MSVGNLKTYGNKGNNFPYQLKVLEGLSLGQCSKLEEFSLTAPTANALETAINLIFQTYPNSYLVSKSVLYDGSDHIAYITLATK